MEKRYLYFVLENGKVMAPYENEVEKLYDQGSIIEHYVSKSGKLVEKITYPDNANYDESCGGVYYTHYTSDYKYLGKVVAKFKTINDLVNYLKGKYKKQVSK